MSTERPPYQLFPVKAEHVHLVTPHMKRITVDGSSLADFRNSLPAQWLKVFVPFRDGERQSGRAYTIRHFDRATKKLVLDFVLHGDNGPISAWASRAEIGDAFHISAPHPRSGFAVVPTTEDYLLFGDETALPAIGGILEAVPAKARARVFVEVADAREEQELASAASLTVTWLHRETRTAGSRSRLEEAARNIDLLPLGAGEIWVAAESAEVSAIRNHMLKERCVDRKILHAVGYWKRGEADHRDDEASA